MASVTNQEAPSKDGRVLEVSQKNRLMKYGDTVILYEGPGRLSPVRLTYGMEIANRFGVFKHDDFINKPYGSKVYARYKGSSPIHNGFLYALELTPELWTVSLPHRTQILYTVDISTVIMHLKLRPGSVVVESGTGSGSLTHALARTVAPTGKVMTYEFNLDRVNKAKEEFREHKIDNIVTVTHRDAVMDGFLPETKESEADAVFLDLPNPWVALKHAYKVLAPGGVLCSFSPCIEQVQRTCYDMADMGFEEIRTFESLLRPFNVVDVKHQVPSIQLNSHTIASRLPTSPAKDVTPDGASPTPGTKRSLEPETSEGAGTVSPPVILKKPLVDFPAEVTSELAEMAGRPHEPLPSCIPVATIRGHTGYLSFGVLYKKNAKYEDAVEVSKEGVSKGDGITDEKKG